MMILLLVAMTGLKKCCITSAYLQWLFHSGERAMACGPLVTYIFSNNLKSKYDHLHLRHSAIKFHVKHRKTSQISLPANLRFSPRNIYFHREISRRIAEKKIKFFFVLFFQFCVISRCFSAKKEPLIVEKNEKWVIIFVISSPEHEVLKVSHCDQSMSVVRRATPGPIDWKPGRKYRGDL